MGMAMASVSVLVLELSPVADQGANSAALQLADAFGSIVFIGIAGAIFTTFRGGPGASAGAFAAILLTMAAVTLVAALLAPRIRPAADRRHALTAADEFAAHPGRLGMSAARTGLASRLR